MSSDVAEWNAFDITTSCIETRARCVRIGSMPVARSASSIATRVPSREVGLCHCWAIG